MADFQATMLSGMAESVGRRREAMLYAGYEMQKGLLAGGARAAKLNAELLMSPLNPLSYTGVGPMMASALDVFAHAAAIYGKPAFGLDSTEIDGKTVPVREEVILQKPFGQLKRFVREGVTGDPKLLIVAPMSGHYATLLRGTVERMLPGHDVHITDWRDARNVPLSEGDFGLDDYVDYVIEFLKAIGPDTHVLAVCQPSVPVYIAAALMAEDKNPCRPLTMTLMGGPIDTRKAPTVVNELAVERPLGWYEDNVIATVPLYYPGAGRRVYPGFLQLSGFMAMNLGNHMMSHWDMFKNLVRGDDASADATKRFYAEYRAVCDMDAKFYLETVEKVFQQHLLPKGEMTHRGRKVDASKIDDIAILAIEGEFDDISGLGQTKAALDMSTGLSDEYKQYYMAEKVGHYGIFNGSRWRGTIAPVVERWIDDHAAR